MWYIDIINAVLYAYQRIIKHPLPQNTALVHRQGACNTIIISLAGLLGEGDACVLQFEIGYFKAVAAAAAGRKSQPLCAH